jgi:hypothetical protein
MFPKKTRDLYQDIIVNSYDLKELDNRYYNCKLCNTFLSVTEIIKHQYKIKINFSNN